MQQDEQRRSFLCPQCRKLISVDELQCPYCGLSHPNSPWKNNLWTRTLVDPEFLIKAIVAANAVMFILALLLNPGLGSLSLNPFAFLSPDNRSLLLLGATGTLPIDRFGRWWTLLSASYLHGSILHILFNMMALKQIGYFVIQEYGPNRMFTLYTLSGVCGYVASYVFGVPFTLGASAAVCGLVGAALYYGKSRGGTYGQEVTRQVGGWVIGIFVFGFLMPGINNYAHGGGLLGGILVASLLGYEERVPENIAHKLFGRLCLVVTLGVLAWSILSGLLYSFS